jgi:hypothetical protein
MFVAPLLSQGFSLGGGFAQKRQCYLSGRVNVACNFAKFLGYHHCFKATNSKP